MYATCCPVPSFTTMAAPMSSTDHGGWMRRLGIATMYYADGGAPGDGGNNEPYRMAIWGRRCRSVGCHEARRNKRGYACPLIVGIVTGRAGMDHVCRGTQPVLDQERTIRLRRNGRGRQKKYRLV